MTARHRRDVRHGLPTSKSEAPCGWDDPVPSVGSSEVSAPSPMAHTVERAVQRRLIEELGLQFSSLVVRRVKDGVCLQGVLELDEETDVPDLSRLARQVEGVNQVIDRVLVHQMTSSGC